MNPVIEKDAKYVFKKIVTDVTIYEPALTGGGFKNIGHIEKASLKMTATKRVIEELDESEFQIGYDFEFELRSLQFYSMYEFEKFRNKVCIINTMQAYIKNIKLNIELDNEVNSGKGVIVIRGKKFIANLRDAVDGNPWGALPEPWPNPDSPPNTSPDPWLQYAPGVSDPDYFYIYKIQIGDPLLAFQTPASPTAEDDITRMQFTVVDNYHNPVRTEPANVAMSKILSPSDLEVIDPLQFTVRYANGLYVIDFEDQAMPSEPLKLEDSILVRYDL